MPILFGRKVLVNPKSGKMPFERGRCGPLWAGNFCFGFDLTFSILLCEVQRVQI